MQPRVSLIVPVYNGEKWLERCVQSLLAQTMGDFELLLIDDGSEDSTPELCDQWAQRDQRIHVFHQKNSGVSAARNVGLDYAMGEWVAFVDVDDWVAPNYLQTLTRKQSELPARTVLVSSLVIEEERGCFEEILVERLYLRGEGNALLLEFKLFAHGFSAAKLYNRELIEKSHLRFDETITFKEDLFFFLAYLKMVDKIYVMNYAGYHYWRGHSEALSQKFHNFDHEYRVFQMSVDKLNEFALEWGGDQEIVAQTHSHYSNGSLWRALSTLYRSKGEAPKGRLRIIRCIHDENRDYLRQSPILTPFPMRKPALFFFHHRLFLLFSLYMKFYWWRKRKSNRPPRREVWK